MSTQTLSAEDLAHGGRWLARLWEILPGALAWLFLLSPIILSFIEPILVVYLIIAYDLLWLSKNFGNATRLLRGYARMRRISRALWQDRLADLEDPAAAMVRVGQQLKNGRLNALSRQELREYLRYLKQLMGSDIQILKPDSIYHAAIVATLNEPLEILEGTILYILKTTHRLDRVWLVIAYEERGGPESQRNAEYLIKKYGSQFGYARAIKHPQNIPGEVKAKAGNITYAARKLTEYAASRGIKPDHILVTTLDADNRPHPQYFSHLTFIYASTPNRVRKSYQPLPMFLNNIWDVPAAMRVVASWNSFWILSEATRPHRLRNFSSHAQSLQTLIDTDYWNVRSIVEDGHQFWRTYYRYEGDHQAIPIYIPVYQDAVLANSYFRTFRAQFKQLRRWAWGSSDISYVFVSNLRHKKINWATKWWYFLRLFEGFFTWATAPLILAFGAWIPLLLNSDFSNQVIAHQLPVLASYIQTVAMVGAIATLLVSLATLPPRPARYRRHRHLAMIFQWGLLPFVAIGMHSVAALNAMTRLMLGKYLEFDVTEKAVKK